MYAELGHTSMGLEITADGLEKLDDAEQQAEEGLLRGMLLAAAAYLHMLSGDQAHADARLAEADALGSDSTPGVVMEYMGIWVVFSTLAKGSVRLVQGDFAGALATAEDDLGKMREKEMRSYLPDVLRMRGEALLGLGRTDEALASLSEAKAEAERQGSRRSLWPVLARLAEFEEERGNAGAAADLRQEARSVIEYIADHAEAAGLRETFTSMPRVRAVLDAPEG